MIATTFYSQQPGQRMDWQELEGCYVLRPPAGRPAEAVVHFLGGAFVGAAPQVSYRCVACTGSGVLVVASRLFHCFVQVIAASCMNFTAICTVFQPTRHHKEAGYTFRLVVPTFHPLSRATQAVPGGSCQPQHLGDRHALRRLL